MKPVSKRTYKKSRTCQKGVAAVELAILLPMFGILLLGILEVGGMAHDYQVIENAAREGARFSALSSNDIDHDATNQAETRIKNRIIAYLANERITTVAAGDIVVNQEYVIMVGAKSVMSSQITVNYARPVMFPGIARWLPLGSTTLKGQAVFRNFY